MRKGNIAIIGEYDPNFEPHAATNRAIEHSTADLGVEVDARWVSTDDIDESLKEASGFWIAPGSPYKNMEKTLSLIRFARENNLPCFGTCGGFQHMVIEYARNVLGYRDAQHAEYDPYASNLFISQLECSLAGRKMNLKFEPKTLAARIYGRASATESYYCNFGVNADVVPLLRSGELKISGSDDEGEIRVIELPSHVFYFGTLFVPQLRSTRKSPHPLVTAFVNAASLHAHEINKPS